MAVKDTRTILLASLIAAMILPSGMGMADVKQTSLTQTDLDNRFGQVNDVYDDKKYYMVSELISKLGVIDSSKTKDSGEKITHKNIVTKHNQNTFKIITISKSVTSDGDNYSATVTYFVIPNNDGSLFIHVPDARPSEGSNVDGSDGLRFVLRPEPDSPIPLADATSGTKKITMEVNRSINNNFVDGSDSFVQNCGLFGTMASMYGSADATTIGSYWRAINANTGGAWWYHDWCIVPHTYEGVEFEMGGSSYSDSLWKTTWGLPGWGPAGGLQFPLDDLHFRTNVYYN